MIRMVLSSYQPNLRGNPAKTLIVNDSKPERNPSGLIKWLEECGHGDLGCALQVSGGAK